jgi:hypothetical protein
MIQRFPRDVLEMPWVSDDLVVAREVKKPSRQIAEKN